MFAMSLLLKIGWLATSAIGTRYCHSNLGGNLRFDVHQAFAYTADAGSDHSSILTLPSPWVPEPEPEALPRSGSPSSESTRPPRLHSAAHCASPWWDLLRPFASDLRIRRLLRCSRTRPR